jgi:hypothetical protein
MRHLKTTMIIFASLVLTVFLGLAGCDEDHGGRHIHGDRDRPPEHKRDHRPPERRRDDRDRHKDRSRNSDHDRDENGVSVTW